MSWRSSRDEQQSKSVARGRARSEKGSQVTEEKTLGRKGGSPVEDEDDHHVRHFAAPKSRFPAKGARKPENKRISAHAALCRMSGKMPRWLGGLPAALLSGQVHSEVPARKAGPDTIPLGGPRQNETTPEGVSSPTHKERQFSSAPGLQIRDPSHAHGWRQRLVSSDRALTRRANLLNHGASLVPDIL